jgi:lipoprotein-anchoring transpeptidase ErfK/SrfK
MQRYRRLSRPLIAALSVVIVLGISIYLHKLSRARAADLRASRETKEAPATPVAIAEPANNFTAPSSTSSGQAQTQPTAVPTPAEPAALVSSTPLPESTPPATTRPALLLAADIEPHHDLISNAPPTTVPSTPLSANPLADAKTSQQSGDLVGARETLNDALLSGRLSDAETEAARQSIAQLNQTLVFSPKRFADDPWVIGYPVQSGERLSTIANKNGVTWQFLARINNITPRQLRAGATIKVIKGPFFAVVTKSKFRMDVYLGGPGGAGSMFVASYPVGLGKDDSTPTGTWEVAGGNKILHPRYYSPRGEGVIEADDPKNPLGGYWIGLQGLDGQAVGKNSYGIHGTIDPDSIGKQASLGCIRLRHEDIAMVFDLMVETRSKIVID